MYTEQSWFDGKTGRTPVSADRLQHMEDGIFDADTAVLTPTAVKTAAYTAVAGDFVPCDSTAGAFTVTLPTAPPNKSRVAVKVIASAATVNPVTVARGGTDVLNRTGGNTSLSLTTLNHGVLLQYSTTGGIWYVVNDSLAIAALQAMFLASGSVIDLSALATTSTAAGTGIGDKLSLYSNFGLGAQANRMVAYLASGGAFAVRAASGTGARSSGAELFYVDTFGHLVVGTGTGTPAAPTAAAGANAGTTPPAPVVSAASRDQRGSLTFGTGTAPAAGAQAVLTFANAYPAAPFVTITPLNAATAALQPYVSATAAGSFTVSFGVAPAASQANTVYSLAWQAIG